MAANIAVAQDPAGNLKLAKEKSTKQIDGIAPPLWPSAGPGLPRRSRNLNTPCSLCDRWMAANVAVT